jgi:hypothetical protein
MDHLPQTPQDIVSFENSASQIVYKVIIIVLLHTYSEGLVKEHTATAIPFMYSFSLSDLYIPRISLHISSSRTGRPIVGIYNSLTDT